MNVRFAALDTLMRSYDFEDDQQGSHVTYEHRRYTDIRCAVVKPHGGETLMKRVYVKNALAAIDSARAREASSDTLSD